VLSTLRSRFAECSVVEGRFLREEKHEESAPARDRAAELMDFLTRPNMHAVMPPWGGERALELLPLLDFERLRAAEAPRWLLGYSDTSTVLVPLLLCADWASVHGPQLMDWAPNETDEHTVAPLYLLRDGFENGFEQRASPRFIGQWRDFATEPDATFHFTEETRWRSIGGGGSGGAADEVVHFEGRLIGGCLDTLMHLAGTPYGDVPGFIARHAKTDGVILFLENVEQSPTGVLRALTHLRLAGWMTDIAGILIGRSAYKKPVHEGNLTYEEAVLAALGDLSCPVVINVDIGHVPPQLTLIEGARATVTRDREGQWRVSQRM